MEEEKKLVPFRLCTLLDEYSWGSEEWHLADLGWRDTAVRDSWLAGNMMGEVMETYLDRVVGDEVFDWYGLQFPFCIKTLNVEGRMPLTACPEDLTALERYDSLGKEKFWYVLEASPEAKIFLGLKKEVDASGFVSSCEDGSITAQLNQAPLKAGAFFHIPTGVPHSIAGKAKVLEISQSSALDFRLFNWGATIRDGSVNEPGASDFGLGLVEALDFLRLGRYPAEGLLGYSLEDRREGDPDNLEHLVSLPQFSVNRLSLPDPIKINVGEGGSCVAYTCIKGELSVQLPKEYDSEEKVAYLSVKAGETVLIPAEVAEFFLVPLAKGTVLLETLVEHRSEEDPYIR